MKLERACALLVTTENASAHFQKKTGVSTDGWKFLAIGSQKVLTKIPKGCVVLSCQAYRFCSRYRSHYASACMRVYAYRMLQRNIQLTNYGTVMLHHALCVTQKSLGECQIQRTGNMYGSGYPSMSGGVDPLTVPDGTIQYAGDDFLKAEVYFEATPCQFEGPDKIFVEIFANPTEGIGGNCDSGTPIASQDLEFSASPFDNYNDFFHEELGYPWGPCFPLTYNGKVGRAAFTVSDPVQSGINKDGFIDMCVRVSIKRQMNGALATASYTDTVVKQKHVDGSSSGHIFNYVTHEQINRAGLSYPSYVSYDQIPSYAFYDPTVPCFNECPDPDGDVIPETSSPETSVPEDALLLCAEDDIKLLHTFGETSYPLGDNPVEIIKQEKSTVTVGLIQNWPSSAPIERIFYSYFTNHFTSKCFEEVNVVQGSSITGETPIEITCGILASVTVLEICLQDSNLKPGDNASIPKCCHSDAIEGTPETSSVCYKIEINCESSCTTDSVRRNLRSLQL